MVAPVDAKATFEVEGETITLRLNWRSIALGEELGVDLFSPDGVKATVGNSALLLKCLASTDHPQMSLDEALACLMRFGIAEFGAVVIDLVARFGSKSDEETEGNGEAATTAA